MNSTLLTPHDLFLLIPQHELKKLTVKWEMDKGVKKLSTKYLTEVMIAAVIYNWKSLRDIQEATGVKKSTLADALAQRSFGFFDDLFSVILKQIKSVTRDRKVTSAIRELLAIDSSGCQTNGALRRFTQYKANDQKASTKFHAVFNVSEELIEDFRITGHRRNDLTTAKTIEVKKGATYVFDRAYIDLKYWRSIEKSGAFFVTRLKKGSNRMKYIHHANLDPLSKQTGVLHDGRWTPSESQAYQNNLKPKELHYRHVIYRDPATNKIFDFITNDIYAPAQEVADIYKKRWAVETLFKWMKTHANLRKTTMKNRNAIRIHIICGVITHLLLRLKIISENISATTTAEMLRKFRHHIFFKRYENAEDKWKYDAKSSK